VLSIHNHHVGMVLRGSYGLLLLLMLTPPAQSSLHTVRLRARLQYDGAGFHGVQKNRRTQDGLELRTVHLTLEQGLEKLALDQEVRKITFAGRTDAGVSASGQVATIDLRSASSLMPASELAGALNACLPDDLQCLELVEAPPTFDVVRDCAWKRYRYHLPACEPTQADDELRLLKIVASHAARGARQQRRMEDGEHGSGEPPMGARRRRRRRAAEPLAVTHIAAMRHAATLLEGTHDFDAFQAGGGDAKGSVRTVFRCAIEPRIVTGGSVEAYDVVVVGDGFLFKMVRIIAGTLLMVGMGLAPPETVLIALAPDAEGKTPSAAAEAVAGRPKAELRRLGVVGPILPPDRLCLEHIEYYDRTQP
jgi:tRNA pseudouridine38-40 synthase